MVHRTAVHDATKFTPAYLMFGHELRTPVDLVFGVRPPAAGEETMQLPNYVETLQQRLAAAHEFARGNIRGKGNVMKRRYDARASAPRFLPGQLIWLTNTTRGRKGHESSETVTWAPTPSCAKLTTSITSSG